MKTYFVGVGGCHKIIDDRIEKSIKGRRIGHYAFAASIFKVQRLRQYKADCVGVESRGRGAGLVLPWRELRPPPFPTPGQAWGTYVVCGCCPPPTLCVNLPSAKTFFIAASVVEPEPARAGLFSWSLSR